MRARLALVLLAVGSSACTSNGIGPCPSDGGTSTSGADGGHPDAGAQCSVNGNFGSCLDVTVCAALPSFSATTGLCSGPSNIQCCALTPSVANNPPVPSGLTLMQQASVTPAMTAWAVAILNSPDAYPMFSLAAQTFGSATVVARVEWLPPDFQNSAVHRGVTLYQ